MAETHQPRNIEDEFNSRAVIIDPKTGKSVLVRERGQTHFALPGGNRELGESPRDTIIRELAEELPGLDTEGLIEAGILPNGDGSKRVIFAGLLRGHLKPGDEIEEVIAVYPDARINGKYRNHICSANQLGLAALMNEPKA